MKIFNKTKENITYNNGITLVALVVTIVILLILAGITITMLFSDNGIIRKAQEAANKTAEDKANTEEGIRDLAHQMDVALDNSDLAKLIKAGKKVTENKTVKDRNGKEITIPGGYKVLDITNVVDEGVVIQDDLGNEYVWVPVNSEQLNEMYGTTGTGTDARKFGKLYEFGKYNSTTKVYDPYTEPHALDWDENGIKSTGIYSEPDILTSTTYGDASTTAGRGIEQLKNVVGISTTGEGETEKDKVLNNWKKELEDKFEEMIESVREYKGFYIGRYETGSWTTDKTNIPKVQKGQTVASDGVNWYYQYAETKNLIKMKDASNNYVDNPNVITSMIWGCQFDRTLEWIAQTNLTEDGKPNYGLLTDSSSWGNYDNYVEVTGDTSTVDAGKKALQSGTNQNWQKNNIFDLAGNAYDWTIEADSWASNYPLHRVKRGGSYGCSGLNYPAFRRSGSTAYSSDSFGYYGSRSTLYISVALDAN